MSKYAISQAAPSVICRSSVRQPLLTGFAIIDTLIPIGCGQRQLIIGDRFTGKSYLAKSIIANQKRMNRYLTPETFGKERLLCVYICIGLRQAEVCKLYRFFQIKGSAWYVSIRSACAATPCFMQYSIAFKGCAVGEFYRDSGYNTVVIYDSITNHAIAHRQGSLLLRVKPGREAYPGDTFYTHARLLERAAQLTKRLGYGSLTALPIVETQANNLEAYIPTNIISITDGQIFLTKDLANQKIYPAMDIEKSVSRIGSKAQIDLIKAISTLLQTMLQNYHTYTMYLRYGYNLSAEDYVLYYKGICAFNLCQQRTARFFEENVILILAADAGLLCPKQARTSIQNLLVSLYTKQYR